MVTDKASADELLALARTDEQRRFATEAIAFLRANVSPRTPQHAAWGVGDEGLTLFHETSDEQERAEADAARGLADAAVGGRLRLDHRARRVRRARFIGRLRGAVPADRVRLRRSPT